MAKKKYNKKKIKKLFDKKCFFCDCDTYELLDVHRILEGKEGGKYHWWNMLTVCAICHRKIHSEIIKVLGKHPCTGPNLWVLHYIEDGEEKWKGPK